MALVLYGDQKKSDQTIILLSKTFAKKNTFVIGFWFFYGSGLFVWLDTSDTAPFNPTKLVQLQRQDRKWAPRDEEPNGSRSGVERLEGR
jgi:hypothetical protein